MLLPFRCRLEIPNDGLPPCSNRDAYRGIGNPASFKKTLIKNKFNIIKEIIFADQYKYTSYDIVNIKKIAKELGAKIITTEKDYIKLKPKDNKGINFLEVKLVLKKEKELINLIKTKI